jgi:hypothetical protein
MPETIQLKETHYIRSRPDILFRLACDPARRAKWDKNLRSARYKGEEKLVNGSEVLLYLPLRLGGSRWNARYTNVQAPTRATLESTKPFGFFASLQQQWTFKPIPGGTEVTFQITALPRFGFIRRGSERILRAVLAQTLIDLQRQVDAAGAESLLETAKEVSRAQRKQKRDAKVPPKR